MVVRQTSGLAVTTKLIQYNPVLTASTVHVKEPKDVLTRDGLGKIVHTSKYKDLQQSEYNDNMSKSDLLSFYRMFSRTIQMGSNVRLVTSLMLPL